MQRRTGKLRRTSWLSKHPKRKSKPNPRSLLQLTKPRGLHSKPSQQQTLMIAHLMIHPLMTTHRLQTLNRFFYGLTDGPKAVCCSVCYPAFVSLLLHHSTVSFLYHSVDAGFIIQCVKVLEPSVSSTMVMHISFSLHTYPVPCQTTC